MRRLRHEQEAAEVDGELQIDLLGRELFQPAADADARRVDEHVKPPMSLVVLAHEPLAIFVVRDVSGDGERAESPRRPRRPCPAGATRASERTRRRRVRERSRDRYLKSRR